MPALSPLQTGKVFKTIAVVSFSGSIAPGVITMGVLQAVLAGGASAGIWFSLGCVSVETLFVWIINRGASWFYQRKNWFRIMEWVAYFLLIFITISIALKVSDAEQAQQTTPVIPVQAPWLLSGLVWRLITPTFISFWLGWSIALQSTRQLSGDLSSDTAYALGAGFGTFVAHLLFIGLSIWASEFIPQVQQIGNYIILIVLILSLILMSHRLFFKNKS